MQLQRPGLPLHDEVIYSPFGARDADFSDLDASERDRDFVGVTGVSATLSILHPLTKTRGW
jgi:hypothetical protein